MGKPWGRTHPQTLLDSALQRLPQAANSTDYEQLQPAAQPNETRNELKVLLCKIASLQQSNPIGVQKLGGWIPRPVQS